jgi:hypothetical protein
MKANQSIWTKVEYGQKLAVISQNVAGAIGAQNVTYYNTRY